MSPHLGFRVKDILVSARIHKEAIINLIICVDSRPLSVALSRRKPPFRKCFEMCDRCIAGSWKLSNLGHQTIFGTTSWRRTFESLRVAFPYVSHRFTLGLAFLGCPLVGLFGCFLLGSFLLVCLCLFCFGRLPTMSRWRSFLPDLMTVRAVMVRAALEKKKEKNRSLWQLLAARPFGWNASPQVVHCS